MYSRSTALTKILEAWKNEAIQSFLDSKSTQQTLITRKGVSPIDEEIDPYMAGACMVILPLEQAVVLLIEDKKKMFRMSLSKLR